MNLRTKLTLIIVAVVSMALGAIAWGSALFTERFMSDAISLRGARAAPLLSAALAAPLAERDYATAQQILDEIRRDDGVAWLILHDASGRQVAAVGRLESKNDPASAETRAFEAPVTLGGQPLGSLRYGLSTTIVARLGSELFAFQLKLGAAALAALALVLVGLGIYLTRPLQRLSEATKEIRAGRFDVALPRASNDEIGMLTEGFRTMASELKARLAELEGKESHLRQLLAEAREREAQLARAKTAAEAANVAKSRFLTNMSHELRTPLAGVLGMIELVLDTPLDAQQRSLVATAHDSGWTLLHLLNDLLDFGKHDQVSMVLERAPFDLHGLIENTAALFRGRAEQKSLALDWTFDDDRVPNWIVGDADRLRQVLANLIGNAIKFTERGTVRLRVTSPTPGRLRIAVEDTGIGIDAADITRVFEPFVQVDDALTRRHQGAGLGLSITRQIVHAMGGTIEVSSRPGEGTAFVCELPVEPAPAPQSRARDAPGTRPRLAGRVLIVEDNPTNLAVAEAIVRELGCQTLAAASGAGAIAAIGAERVDAVLMDCQMPDMDGFETTARIRAHEAARSARRVPIIAVTAHAAPDDRRRCLERGMDDYIAKPYRRGELERVLGRWLTSSAAAA